MNVMFFLNPKSKCTYIYEDYTIRQALERWEPSRFSSIPVLKRSGEYVGTITEGDLLWAIKNKYTMNMKDAEERPINEITRRRDYRPVAITTTMKELLEMAVDQNFVPMVDDRGAFIGIVTRQRIMEYCMDKYFAHEEIE